MGLSTGDFEIWLKGAVEVECLSPWVLCEGNQRKGSLAADSEECVGKAVEMGPVWGTCRRAHPPGTSRDYYRMWGTKGLS